MKGKEERQLSGLKPGKTMALLPGMGKQCEELGLVIRGHVQNVGFGKLGVQHFVKCGIQSTVANVGLKLRRQARVPLKVFHHLFLIIMTRNLQFMTKVDL